LEAFSGLLDSLAFLWKGPASVNFQFGQHSLDTDTVQLKAGSVEVELEPQTFLLLQFLIENRERVVSKDEIFEAVWEGRIVADSTLAFAVNAVRRAVGDDGKAQAVIRTFPRRGFRFVAPVVETQVEEVNGEAGTDDPLTPRQKAPSSSDAPPDGAAATRPGAARRWRMPAIAVAVLVIIATGGLLVWQPWAPTLVPASVENTTSPIHGKPSVAVLPFQNLSDDPSQDYFADGIAEDLITDLSKISSLLVIARNSSFQYRDRPVDVVQVGQELNVHYILEGSVRRAEDRVRMNVQLIDATTGGEIWAERYDGSLDDVFALQDKVTGRIIEALSLTLGADDTARLADHGTANIAAHDAFLRGQELSRRYTAEGAAQAITHYKRALELDPGYSRASAAMAQILYTVWRIYWVQAAELAGYAGGGKTGVNRALAEAKGYAQKALENPTPAAHIAQALLLQPGRPKGYHPRSERCRGLFGPCQFARSCR
jgi:TolB-like protein/DNA-binding winged helix-turn-helix (wHTH) protein